MDKIGNLNIFNALGIQVVVYTRTSSFAHTLALANLLPQLLKL